MSSQRVSGPAIPRVVLTVCTWSALILVSPCCAPDGDDHIVCGGGFTVEGTVTDSHSSAFLEDVEVTLGFVDADSIAYPTCVETDSTGAYRYFGDGFGLAPAHRMRFAKPGYETVEVTPSAAAILTVASTYHLDVAMSQARPPGTLCH
jgi:hypothetical protein